MSGEVPDWRQLAHRTEEEITSKGIHLLLNHTAKTIDTANHEVLVVNSDGQENQLQKSERESPVIDAGDEAPLLVWRGEVERRGAHQDA